MRVLVLYETRRGSTLSLARSMRDAIRSRGHQATTAPIRAVDAGTLAAADALIVGTWTRGRILKVGPAPGALEGIATLPPLAGRPVAVFCTCVLAPRGTLDLLTSRLQRKGARVLVAHAFKRRKGAAQVPAYVDLVVEEFERALASPAAPSDATATPTGV